MAGSPEVFQTWRDHPVLGRFFLPLAALVCALLWGSAFPSIKIAYTWIDGSDLGARLAFAGIRFTLAGALLLLFAPERWGALRKAPKHLLFGVTFCQVVFQYLFFYWAIFLIGGVLSAIINATGSFWWILLAPLFDRSETFRPRQLAFVALGFLGVCLCVYQPGSLVGGAHWLGALLMLAATVSGTSASLLIRPLHKHVPITFLTGFSLLAGGVILMLLSPMDVVALIRSAHPPLILLTLYLACVSAVAFRLWYFLITLYDVPTLSGYRYLVPLCGVLESMLFLTGEYLGPMTAIGGGLVFFCVWGLERMRRGARPPYRAGV